MKPKRNYWRSWSSSWGAYKPAGDVDSSPVFHGGAGRLPARDAVRYFEPSVPKCRHRDQSSGRSRHAVHCLDTVVIFDHRYRSIIVAANAPFGRSLHRLRIRSSAGEKIDAVIAKLRQPLHPELMTLSPPWDNPEPLVSTLQEEYMGWSRRQRNRYPRARHLSRWCHRERFEVEFTPSRSTSTAPCGM
ncbi:MAG: hypothetical protein R3F19_34430 [Verrucomicrobiales bacterium]